MLNKFLLTAIVAVIFSVAVNVLFTLTSAGWFDIPQWLGISLYFSAFYLAPLAFLVGVIGSIVCVIKSRVRKRAHDAHSLVK